MDMKKFILTFITFVAVVTSNADNGIWWQLKTDGSQYPWVTEEYSWGTVRNAEGLLQEYRKQADTYVEIGLNYPKSEVNYEQSIVAPSVNFLLEVYLVTKDEKYLSAAKELLPVVEAFGGRQPSSHLSDISIRHWDGYWFGLPKQWGDTFPHYWSCVTADCFMNFAESTGDMTYQQRAEKIVEANLSLFTEDGRGGAAYIYPAMVNGKPAHGLLPFANDQDTALMYYMKIKRYTANRSNMLPTESTSYVQQ